MASPGIRASGDDRGPGVDGQGVRKRIREDAAASVIVPQGNRAGVDSKAAGKGMVRSGARIGATITQDAPSSCTLLHQRARAGDHTGIRSRGPGAADGQDVRPQFDRAPEAASPIGQRPDRLVLLETQLGVGRQLDSAGVGNDVGGTRKDQDRIVAAADQSRGPGVGIGSGESKGAAHDGQRARARDRPADGTCAAVGADGRGSGQGDGAGEAGPRDADGTEPSGALVPARALDDEVVGNRPSGGVKSAAVQDGDHRQGAGGPDRAVPIDACLVYGDVAGESRGHRRDEVVVVRVQRVVADELEQTGAADAVADDNRTSAVTQFGAGANRGDAGADPARRTSGADLNHALQDGTVAGETVIGGEEQGAKTGLGEGATCAPEGGGPGDRLAVGIDLIRNVGPLDELGRIVDGIARGVAERAAAEKDASLAPIGAVDAERVLHIELQNPSGDLGEAGEAGRAAADLVVALEDDGVGADLPETNRVGGIVRIIDGARDRQVTGISADVARPGQDELSGERGRRGPAVGQGTSVQAHDAGERVAHHVEQATGVDADADVLGEGTLPG